MKASMKAYRLVGLIRAAILAHDNDNVNLFLDGRGVTDVLEVAEELAGSLVDDVEALEMAATAAA